MPPHTISPSPSSQGLGISYSTLSPPPACQPQSQSFTGMNLLPRAHSMPFPQNTSTVRALPLPLPSQPSHNRIAPVSTFALRPTHTRQPSQQGFTSFSAIPPSPSGPRAPSSASGSGKYTRNTPRAESVRSGNSEVVEPEMRRNGSTTSTLTTGSKSARKSRSAEFLKDKFSRNETISGGPYVPRFGVDDQAEWDQTTMDERYMDDYEVEDATKASDSSPQFPAGLSSTLAQASPPSSPPRRYSKSTISSSHATPPLSNAPSLGPTPSSDLHAYNPSHFPLPPTQPFYQPVRSSTTLSDPIYHSRPQPFDNPMPRSYSQPLHLQTVIERRESGLSSESYHPNARSSSYDPKRISDPSTGIHSKNAALLSAETGGMMLAFSPSGDGVWRQGEMICGSGTGLIPTPQSIPTNTFRQDPRGTVGDEDEQEHLKARPWSHSTMSHSQPHQHQPQRRPTHRGRSLSEGENLNRAGTLFHPSSSTQRASKELGVMLGKKSRKSGSNQILQPENLQGEVERVRLEVSKKGKARVEVDVVLERECVVEGGEVRGRMEVRVTSGKRSEGLWVGAGKIRVVGFEGELHHLSPVYKC
jgi:hypothetical protein